MERTRYYLFVLLLMNVQFCCPVISQTSLATDGTALLALKAHITLDPYGIITRNWSSSSSVCTWIGVVCGSRHHRVTALNISRMDLTGTIPPQLGNLSFLASLDLTYNSFSGILPPNLSRLHRLKFLSLMVNSFAGEIPPWLGLLDKLTLLSLRNNSFTGTIPEELGKLQNLQMLLLQFNRISGPIPSAICNMSSLKYMAFSYNELNGSLPTNMCRNLPFLEGIYLSFNKFSGHIPSNLSECSQLREVSLSYNLFSGQIPRDIGKSKHLEILYLGGNKLNGVIPQDISNLPSLVMLGLETNQITGGVTNIFNISSLQVLLLRSNKFSGSLPREIGNLTMLTQLDLDYNELTGVLPQELCQLEQLDILLLGSNRFNSPIPQGLFNMSTLRVLELTGNGLTGSLPTFALPSLERIHLSINNFTGAIPHSVSNCSKLRFLSLGTNKFTGFVPSSLGSLRLLERLMLHDNYLTTERSSPEMSFFTSLTNCKFLYQLALSNNPLDGIIPASIGNLSTSLLYFDSDNCKIKGIPAEIGNLSNLVILSLGGNLLVGNIPFSITQFHKLQSFSLENNRVRGLIPKALCNLLNLGYLYLSQNQFSGSIPECLGNLTSLRLLSLHSNALTSSIPPNIWLLKDLLELKLSSNLLSGFLPVEVSNLASAINIDLSMNHFSGDIPNTIGKLQNLAVLSLGHNKLQGTIPVSMGSMINLQTLDLSYNNLFGSIPMSLQQLQLLSCFNVSFNALTGEIPTGGPFKNFTMESFKGNEDLCGIARFHVPPCHIVHKHRSRTKRVRLALFILAGVIACILFAALTFVQIMRCRRKDKAGNEDNVQRLPVLQRISYQELLQATEQFSESNLLGVGGFGSVYKGTLTHGEPFAVKVFNLQLEGVFKSFDVECEVLRNIRHRNLTKVLGSCLNEDFKALVLEYMPNGSLENWLYSRNYWLDVEQRLNIMIDVACALEYLHYGYSMPIVHCDLKPSNVLLDEEMTAHVSDFGIAKLLGEGVSIAHTNTLATLGYIAPEYGMEGLVSTRCDVYSYGIMLMETFTRKKPSDEMFAGDMSIKTWVEGLLLDSPSHVIDANLLNPKSLEKDMQCVSDILELALKCSVESPGDRIDMKDVVVKLQKIKINLKDTVAEQQKMKPGFLG